MATMENASSEERLGIIATFIESPVDRKSNSRLLFEKAEGHMVFDVNGKDYIDLINGKGSIILGHNDPGVEAALKSLLKKNQNNLTGPVDAILDLANIIIDDIGIPDSKISFYSTGTSACRAAATAARYITGCNLILSAGYHGWDPMWIQGPALLEPNNEGVLEFFFVPELLETALKRYAGKIALVIFSPDYVYLSPNTILDIISICRKNEVLICCDDVKHGYRHRKGSSLQLVTEDNADLYTFSKGLANGHRISCLIGPSKIMSGCKELTYTSYYDLFPVTAALETLHIMQRNNGYEHLNSIGRKLIHDLRSIFDQTGLPISVNGDGSIFQFVFGTDRLEEAFYQKSLESGILLYEGDNQTISLCFNDEVISDLLRRFETVIDKILPDFSDVEGDEITDERTFMTAWNMIDGASDILPYEKTLKIIEKTFH